MKEGKRTNEKPCRLWESLFRIYVFGKERRGRTFAEIKYITDIEGRERGARGEHQLQGQLCLHSWANPLSQTITSTTTMEVTLLPWDRVSRATGGGVFSQPDIRVLGERPMEHLIGDDKSRHARRSSQPKEDWRDIFAQAAMLSVDLSVNPRRKFPRREEWLNGSGQRHCWPQSDQAPSCCDLEAR